MSKKKNNVKEQTNVTSYSCDYWESNEISGRADLESDLPAAYFERFKEALIESLELSREKVLPLRLMPIACTWKRGNNVTQKVTNI